MFYLFFLIVRNNNHKEYDCVVIAVLSHGELLFEWNERQDGVVAWEQSEFLYARDVKYRVRDLTNYLTGESCSGLIKKPKIFFIEVGQ